MPQDVLMLRDVSRFEQAEFANQVWVLTVPTDTELEDVLKPQYLGNVASRLRPYDKIQVRIDTGEWYAELLVIESGRAWIKAVALLKVDLVTQEIEVTDVADAEAYYIQHRGPHLKFCVIRKLDQECIKEKCASKVEAITWLNNYLITM